MPEIGSSIIGTVTVVQERRFLLLDDAARFHLFLLAPEAAVEPSALKRLAEARMPVSVAYRDARGLQARVAYAVCRAEQGSPDAEQ